MTEELETNLVGMCQTALGAHPLAPDPSDLALAHQRWPHLPDDVTDWFTHAGSWAGWPATRSWYFEPLTITRSIETAQLCDPTDPYTAFAARHLVPLFLREDLRQICALVPNEPGFTRSLCVLTDGDNGGWRSLAELTPTIQRLIGITTHNTTAADPVWTHITDW